MTQPHPLDTVTYMIVRLQEPRPSRQARKEQAKNQKQERLGIFFGWAVTTEAIQALIDTTNASISLNGLHTANFSVKIYRNPETARSIDGCRILRSAGTHSDTQDAYLSFTEGRARLSLKLGGELFRSESFGLTDLHIAKGEHFHIIRQRERQSTRSAYPRPAHPTESSGEQVTDTSDQAPDSSGVQPEFVHA